jgi:ammonia channel protein AmtB
MPRAGYFAGIVGAILIGLIAILVTGVLFLLLLPYLIQIFVGFAMLGIAFMAIYVVTYAALFIGIAIYYAIKHPMRVEKKDKKYSIDKTKEAGRRQKG